MHVYIAPKPGNPVLRRCTVLLSLTRTCSNPVPTSTPNGTDAAIKGQRITQTYVHHALSDSHFYG